MFKFLFAARKRSHGGKSIDGGGTGRGGGSNRNQRGGGFGVRSKRICTENSEKTAESESNESSDENENEGSVTSSSETDWSENENQQFSEDILDESHSQNGVQQSCGENGASGICDLVRPTGGILCTASESESNARVPNNIVDAECSQSNAGEQFVFDDNNGSRNGTDTADRFGLEEFKGSERVRIDGRSEEDTMGTEFVDVGFCMAEFERIFPNIRPRLVHDVYIVNDNEPSTEVLEGLFQLSLRRNIVIVAFHARSNQHESVSILDECTEFVQPHYHIIHDCKWWSS